MNNEEYIIKQQLAELENALTDQLPTVKTLLRDVHKQLKADQELVTVLSDEEVAILVRSLDTVTKAELAATVVKSAKKSTKAMSKMTVNDL